MSGMNSPVDHCFKAFSTYGNKRSTRILDKLGKKDIIHTATAASANATYGGLFAGAVGVGKWSMISKWCANVLRMHSC
jgi:hypothetical protein